MNFCENCGLCCMHMRTPPFLGLDDPQWAALPQELKNEIDRWLETPRFNLMVQSEETINPCIWLDLVSGECKHYELRPDVCRDYEVGCAPCRAVREEVGLTVRGMPVEEEQ